MPKRNRANEQRKQFGSTPKPASPAAATNEPAAVVAVTPPKPVADDAATRAAKMFAESLQAHEAADRAERDQLRVETEMMRQHEVLRADKQRAADLIKQLRGQSGTRQKMIEAEAAYRVALAELQEFETGERPHWAPAKAEELSVDGDAADSTVDDASGEVAADFDSDSGSSSE